MSLIYSLDRVRRLRLVLGVAAAAGGLLVLLGVIVLATGSEVYTREAVTIVVVGVLVLAAAVLALVRLPGRDARAKLSAMGAGALTLVSGFVFARMILGFAMIVIGLVVLVLALLRDDPDLAP